jgi:hypothetical protein
VFVATYLDARDDLRYASRQLSMPSKEGLVSTQRGRDAIRQATLQAALASASSMLEALVPLRIAAALPGPGWIAAAVALVALGALGVGLATTMLGNSLIWAATLKFGCGAGSASRSDSHGAC